jgi:putative hydroxymethylpyrimidine transport system permease protein
MSHNKLLLAEHALVTLQETLLGLLLGALAGCFTACLIAFSRPLARWLLPVVIISQALPIFAIAPLLVIWLGYGLSSKIAVAIIMIFFPVTSALYDGLRRTPAGWLELASTMNSAKLSTFWHIQLPAAMPALATGLRLAAVAAPIGAIVGEWVGANKGLGYLMLTANARLQIDMMFAALIIIIILSLILYQCIDQLLKKLVWW